jgi:hypothetical protein
VPSGNEQSTPATGPTRAEPYGRGERAGVADERDRTADERDRIAEARHVAGSASASEQRDREAGLRDEVARARVCRSGP